MITFSVRHADVAFRQRHAAPRTMFTDLSIDVPAGQCMGILGQEGSGKTTLLHLLGGLITPDAGSSVRVPAGKETARVSPDRLRLAFTFQFPDEQFLCKSVSEEFREHPALRGVAPSETADRMEQAMRDVGLDPDGFRERSPFALSLGESRRIAVALAVAGSPDAILMDEPTSGLDAEGISLVAETIRRETRRGTTVILATHDVDFIAMVAERIVMLSGGKIAADGSAAGILADTSMLRQAGYGIL
jgi:energy-coupling factor transport system ATP-binding protein